MKTVAIMQPTYLPWLGYFALMDRVDTFVFLDSVQFERRSWQQRNRIKTADGLQMLTIPVIKKGFRDQAITDVKIDYTSDFYKKHIRAIELAYSRAPFYQKYKESLFFILNQKYERLSDLTTALILEIKGILGIKSQYLNSNVLDPKGTKAELLADICEKLSANVYISPIGSMEYMNESNVFQNKSITVKYNEYVHPQYRQLNGDFVAFVSVIDLIFNEGPNSLDIIRKGIKNG